MAKKTKVKHYRPLEFSCIERKIINIFQSFRTFRKDAQRLASKSLLTKTNDTKQTITVMGNFDKKGGLVKSLPRYKENQNHVNTE